MVDLGVAPEFTEQEQGIENAKKSILIIEHFIYGINQIPGVPLRCAEAILKGCGFLQDLHTGLLKQIGPEEAEKMRKQYQSNAETGPQHTNGDQA